MKKNIEKLMAFVIVLCIASIIFEIYAITSSYFQVRRNNEVISEYLENIQQMNRLENGIYHIQTLTLLALTSEDSVEQKTLWKSIFDLDKENIAILLDLDSKVKDATENQLIHILYSNYLGYSTKQTIISDFAGNGSVDTAKYYLNTDMKESIALINENLSTLENAIDTNLNDVRISQSSKEALRGLFSIFMGILSLGQLVVLVRIIIKSSRSINDEIDTTNQAHKMQIQGMQQQTIEGMAELVESRDNSTGNHIRNTAKYVSLIARELSKSPIYQDILTEDYINRLVQYAPLHDVGKILVPDAILMKPGRFTDEEFEKMKKHASEGGEIIHRLLTNIETKENIKIAQEIAQYHHEKWNGTGYPFGVSGTDIPLPARIMAVADVFDALISVRCYKPSYTVEQAYDIIKDGSGTHFEPSIVLAFLQLRPVIEKYLSEESMA